MWLDPPGDMRESTSTPWAVDAEGVGAPIGVASPVLFPRLARMGQGITARPWLGVWTLSVAEVPSPCRAGV